LKDASSFDERVTARTDRLTPAERDVTRFFQENREEVLLASASSLASRIGTSDATVVRTARTLGYTGLAELRRKIADEIRSDLTPASRLARTLGGVGDTFESAFHTTLAIHIEALEDLRRAVSPVLFAAAVNEIRTARRVVIFGIGPSASIADYLAIQLGRFGVDCATITNTGLLIADDLNRVEKGDLIVILAYTRVYLELDALLNRADAVRTKTILLTDSLAAALRNRVDLIIPVARGQVDSFSMHTATLALVEALLVGIAAAQPKKVLANLKRLNHLRAMVAGKDVELGRTRGSEKPRAGRRRKSSHRKSARA
jgi:DNA-binding MurR/RpiR family transcriptional regulator